MYKLEMHESGIEPNYISKCIYVVNER